MARGLAPLRGKERQFAVGKRPIREVLHRQQRLLKLRLQLLHPLAGRVQIIHPSILPVLFRPQTLLRPDHRPDGDPSILRHRRRGQLALVQAVRLRPGVPLEHRRSPRRKPHRALGDGQRLLRPGKIAPLTANHILDGVQGAKPDRTHPEQFLPEVPLRSEPPTTPVSPDPRTSPRTWGSVTSLRSFFGPQAAESGCSTR